MEPLLGRSGLRELQAISEGSMPHRVLVRRKGAWVDQGGGSGYHTPGKIVAFRCRMAPLQGKALARLVSDRVETEGVELMLCPVDADVQPGDVPIVDGTTYRIVGFPEMPDYPMQRTVLVKRTNAPPR